MCTRSKAQRLIWYSVIANAYAIMHNGRETSTCVKKKAYMHIFLKLDHTVLELFLKKRWKTSSNYNLKKKNFTLSTSYKLKAENF